MSKGLWLVIQETHHSSWCGQDTLFTSSTPSHWCWDRMLASKRSRLNSRRCPAGSHARTLMLQKAQMPATESTNESLPGTWCVVATTADECEMKHFCIRLCEFHIQDTTCKLCRALMKHGCESGACIGQCSETSPAAAHWYGKDHAHMVKYIQEPCSLYEVTHPKGYPYVMVTMSTHMILTWQLKIHVLKMTLPAEHVKPRRLICRDLDLANVQYGSMHWAGNDMCECPPIRSSCLQSGDGSMPQRVGRMRSQTNNRLLMQGVQVNWKTKLDKVTKF